MLDGFQKNLCSISSEIQLLQQQSVNMNIKLKNRQSIRAELSQFIDEMLVPEQMIEWVLNLAFYPKILDIVHNVCTTFRHRL